ncbi:thiamine pyrophosphate-dependent enzyme [Herbiconiux solani]|uniref:thiamine pyrophosphate-dependent enzyme n=1 Tax=Herbiconiux solani TaxID=661329 RepID=UPI0008253A04|nr:thiamine pyrophosphate-dependent enzyme [Herbiconiux solani]
MQINADDLLRDLRTHGVRQVHIADAETKALVRNAAGPTAEPVPVILSPEGSAAPGAAAGESAVTSELAACAGWLANDGFLDGVANIIRTDAAVIALVLLTGAPTDRAAAERLQALADGGARCEVVHDGLHLPSAIARAAHFALEERSVAVVAFSASQLARQNAAGTVELPATAAPDAPRRVPHADDLHRTAMALGASRNVVLVAGGGTADAHDEVLALACILQAPIAHTLRGKENLEWGNPYDIGLVGDSGHSAARDALARADTVVLIGTDFAYPGFIAPGTLVIQIDRDARRIGRSTAVHFALLGDVGETLSALASCLTLRTDKAFMVESTALRRMEEVWFRSEAVTAAFDAENVAALLSEVASADAIFAVDVGPEWHRAVRHLRTNGSRRLIGSMRHGALADAVSRAGGAQSADPERQVIVLAGLRGAAQLGGQLTALAARDLPVKAVLLNPCPATTWLPNGLSGIDVTRLDLFSDARSALTRLLSCKGTAAVEIALGVPSAERARRDLSGALR